mgnify:CR=1 FL=1
MIHFEVSVFDIDTETHNEEQIFRRENYWDFEEARGRHHVKELCRKYGMSDATYYKWKAKYSGLEINEARRLRSLEDENRHLKKLVAYLSLDKMALEEVLKEI